MKKEHRQKHDYTSEIELKSLLIRIKNHRQLYSERGIITEDTLEIGVNDSEEILKQNTLISRMIKFHNNLKSKKYKNVDINRQRTELRRNTYDRIVQLSEKCVIDSNSYERFGNIIILMISRILTKPNFSRYTYQEEFYSDAYYKIIKYLHNFDHTLTSDRTGLPVNAFAYISQYIHNSIIYIIKKMNKESDDLKKQVRVNNISFGFSLRDIDTINKDINLELNTEKIIKEIRVNPDELKHGELPLVNIVKDIIQALSHKFRHPSELITDCEQIHRVNIIYPSEYVITVDEYYELSHHLNEFVSIIREPESI